MLPLALVLLLTATSALALAAGLWLFGLPRRSLRPAAMLTLEIIGFGVAFLALNVAITLLTAIVLRRLSGFVSLYASNDEVLMLCSLLQGIIFAAWRHVAGRTGD